MAEPDWPLLARGRDAEIYDLGDGRVLRRAIDGRSLAAEAAVMAYAYDAGVPVPKVYDVTPEGAVVMDRVDGRPLLAELLTGPEAFAVDAAGVLAELHEAVHRVPAPPKLRRTSLPGDRLLHLDLHVLNVLRTDDGPVLIDWANAKAGPAAADEALGWLTHVTADPTDPATVELVADAAGVDAGAGREVFGRRWRVFLEASLERLDTAGVADVLPEVANWRIADRNVSAADAERVRSAAAAFPELPDYVGQAD